MPGKWVILLERHRLHLRVTSIGQRCTVFWKSCGTLTLLRFTAYAGTPCS